MTRKTIFLGEYSHAIRYAMENKVEHREIRIFRAQSILGHMDTDFIVFGDPAMRYSEAEALGPAIESAKIHGCTVTFVKQRRAW